MEEGKRSDTQKKADNGGLRGGSGRLREFKADPKVLLLMLLEDITVSAAAAWIFYDTPVAFIIVIPVSLINAVRVMDKSRTELENRFMGEYRQMLLALTNALEAGYSIENAFIDAEKNLRQLYRGGGLIVKSIHELNAKVKLRMPIEQAFNEFAAEYPYEEVQSFANIFSFAKRLGGDYVENLRKSALKIEEKVDLKQEINATIAEKKLELKVMMIMPAGIIAYVKLGSPDFLKPMYNNIGGVLTMSGCIAMYVAAMLIGRKIVDIRI